MRSGSTQYLSDEDIHKLRDYGLTHVLDLRGAHERPRETCALHRGGGFAWKNVELFECDVSRYCRPSTGQPLSRLVESYLGMLSNPGAVRGIVAFCARAPLYACVLVHCSEGMDRTGVCAMILLGAAGVGREQVVWDYALSFGTPEEIGRVRAGEGCGRDGQERDDRERDDCGASVAAYMGVMEAVWDALVEAHGSVCGYLRACGVLERDLERLRARLLGR